MRSRILSVIVTLLVAGSIGCTDARERVDGLHVGAQELSQTARFCLSLARAVAAYETGSSATAADAAEEVLVNAPSEVRDDARTVVDGLRRAREGDGDVLGDPSLQDAVRRLRADTRELCDPTP